ENQREKARAAREKISDSGWKNTNVIDLNEKYNTIFKGYETLSTESKVIGIFIDNNSVDTAVQGEEGILLLDKTPFYAERGGQIADIGYIEKEGFKAKVVNTQYTKDETIAHFVKIELGSIH